MAYSNEAYKELAQGQLATSDGVLYTAPASLTVIVRHIVLVNVAASAVTAKLWHTGGGAGSDATLILPSTTMAASGFANFDGVLVMDAADTLRGLSNTATSITYTIYGVELT